MDCETKSQRSENKTKFSLPQGRLELFGMKKRQILLLSFFLPFFICCAVYLIGGFYPVGDKQILVTDLWHQYYQIICEFRTKLLSGGSLLYSWHSGMGTNFIAMMAYYCASPLNLLTLLVPEAGLRIAVSVICFIKISLCGVTFAHCAMYLTKRHDASVIFFSSLFALCAYNMGYFWNIMWLDSVAMFPLVLLGLYKLIKEKKPLLYTVSLFLCLIFNYYIGFYTCIAVFFCAVFITVVCMDRFSFAVRAFFRTLIHSAVAIGLSAFMLLPAYLSLQNTYSVAVNNLSHKMFNGNALDFISAMLPYQEPNTKDLDTPNFYCGVICIFLFAIYFFSRNFKLRERICSSLFLIIIFLSCLFKQADYVWNGLHYTNMIPYRYSFMFSFVLVLMAYRAYCVLERTQLRHIFAGMITVTVICGIGVYRTNIAAPIASFITLSVYAVFTVFYARGVISRRASACALCLVICIEAATAGAFGISNYSTYSTFLTSYDEVKELLARRENEEEFYRTELSTYKTLNDPLLYGYNGISQFSSNANYGVSSLLTHLGAGGYCSGNRYAYSQSTPLTMSFFAIKYIISKEGHNTGDTTLSPVAYSGDSALLEYAYPLPVAFMTHGEYDINLTSSDPFANQNVFFQETTGVSGQLFSRCADPETSISSGTISGSNGIYSITSDSDEKLGLDLTFTCHTDGLYYVYPKIKDASSIYVNYQAGKTSTFSAKAAQCCIIPAGYHRAGEKFTVSGFIDADEASRNAWMYAAVMDTDLFEQGYKKLADEAVYDLSYTDTLIEGKIKANEDGYLYTSIPYEKGWELYIDGKKTDTVKYAGAFVSALIEKGEHEIRLQYSPDGFDIGIIISLASLLLLGISALIYRRKNGKEIICH